MLLAILIAALIYVGYNAKHAIRDYREHRHHHH